VTVQLLRGVDARSLHTEIPGSRRFGAAVTSPPYWGLRRYGDDPNEIGVGPLSRYLADLTAVGQQLAERLEDEAVWWLNIGDTSAGSGGAGGDYSDTGRMKGRPKYRQGDSELAPGQQSLVPLRVAMALQDDGWLVRQVITWAKTTKDGGRNRVRPEDIKHVRRPLFSSEFIFMLTRQVNHRFCPRPELEQGNVWHFPPARNTGHQAPFPDELARRCLMLTFSDEEMHEGNWAIDPFSGSGTTVRVAEQLGLSALGVDLY